MKSCKGQKFMISRFMDGDLLIDEAERFKTHLSQCESCSAIHKSYSSMHNLIQAAYGAKVVPDSFVRIPERRQHSISALVFNSKRTIPITAMIMVIVTASAVFLSRYQLTNQPVPTFAENVSQIMNSPLGSLFYYDQTDGSSIQSQFVSLSHGTTDTLDYSESLSSLAYCTYSSPLFGDNDLNALYEKPTAGSDTE